MGAKEYPMSRVYSAMLERIIQETKGLIGKTQTYQAHTRRGEFREIKFTVQRIIGRGSFGLVSQIESGGCIQALKSVYQDNRYCNREVDILLDIEHANILGLQSYFYTHKTHVGHFLNMTMEYMPMVLEDIFISKSLPEKTLRHLMRQMLAGLSYLHGQSIAHRDMKPANILLDSEFNLKIADFGSAKHLRAGDTNIPYICSRYYRAPENLVNCGNYDTKIDVWAVGAIFCEARMPSPIFAGDSTDAVLTKILGIFGNDSRTLRHLPCPAACAPGIKRVLAEYFDAPALIDVIAAALSVDSCGRLTADELLAMPFFCKE